MAVLPSSVIPTVGDYPELSILSSYINGSKTLFNLLNNANNFTFLAPTNNAITAWIASTNGTPAADVIEAQLSYHLLTGGWTSLDFLSAPQFVSTELTNSSYSNVTVFPSGQRVELVAGAGGNPEIVSSNKTVTTIARKDVLCLNGLIQFVNSVLAIPTSIVSLTAQANMAYFIQILARANQLSINDAGLIEFVNYASFTPNMTFFIPNTAAALQEFESTAPANISAETLKALFDYHIVPDQVLYSPSLVNGTVLKTAQGDNITITKVGNDTYVNAAKVLISDYMIVNGVIHTIDNILNFNNQSIPRAAINSTTPVSHSSSGLSTGAKAAIGVVVPVVVLAALAGLFFWLWRRRKAKRTQELDSNAVAGEMGTNPAAHDQTVNELYSPHHQKKELHSDGPPGELSNEVRPQELAGDRNPSHPIELE